MRQEAGSEDAFSEGIISDDRWLRGKLSWRRKANGFNINVAPRQMHCYRQVFECDSTRGGGKVGICGNQTSHALHIADFKAKPTAGSNLPKLFSPASPIILVVCVHHSVPVYCTFYDDSNQSDRLSYGTHQPSALAGALNPPLSTPKMTSSGGSLHTGRDMEQLKPIRAVEEFLFEAILWPRDTLKYFWLALRPWRVHKSSRVNGLTRKQIASRKGCDRLGSGYSG